jgi:sugar-specific transcriptional regulator TrmB
MLVDLAKELQAVGFSEKQAKVYVACLELGPSPVQKIAQRAGLVRPTTYVILDELSERGLVSNHKKAKKTMFRAEDPDVVFEILLRQHLDLQTKIKKIKQDLARLRSLQGGRPEYPKVKIYEGVEGVMQIQREFDLAYPGSCLFYFCERTGGQNDESR